MAAVSPEAAPDDADDAAAGGASLFAEINITPLTDVFLVMVVIFMVSALAVQAEHEQAKRIEEKKPPSLAVSPPPGTSRDIDMLLPTLVVEIPLAGEAYVGGKQFSDADLDAFLVRVHKHDAQTQLVVRADRGVSHGRVVQVMELARRAGFTRMAIGTAAR